MTNVLKQAQSSPETAMWQQLKNITAVMLGVEGRDNFMSPMAPMVDTDNKVITMATLQMVRKRKSAWQMNAIISGPASMAGLRRKTIQPPKNGSGLPRWKPGMSMELMMKTF